jgi:hypothetical protein
VEQTLNIAAREAEKQEENQGKPLWANELHLKAVLIKGPCFMPLRRDQNSGPQWHQPEDQRESLASRRRILGTCARWLKEIPASVMRAASLSHLRPILSRIGVFHPACT